jgi:hypothetical protein
MLASRTILFVLFQGVIAGIYAISGHPHPWEASAAWWLVAVTLSNLVTLGLLSTLAKGEGMRLVDLYRVERSSFWREAAICLGFTVVAAPLMMLPNTGMATLLWGDPNVPFAMMFKPLPLWVIYITMVAFPVTNALAELPTYYGYSMPRLISLTGKVVPVLLLASFWLALQHSALPLIFDWRFILWRFGMMLPFAIFAGAMLRWRSRLLPFMMVIHGLLDLTLPVMLLGVK